MNKIGRIKPKTPFEREVDSLIGHVIILTISSSKDSLEERIKEVNKTFYSQAIKDATIKKLTQHQTELDKIKTGE